MNSIYDCISYIRKAIQYNTIPTTIKNFRVLTAALDIVGDAEDGLQDYFLLENNHGRGMNYIYVYGAINLMNIESQAVKVISKILTNTDINLTQNPDLDIIRIIRNKILAHPIDLNGSVNGYGIIASQLATFSFSPYSFLSDTYTEKENNETIYDCVKKLEDGKNTSFLTIDINDVRKGQEKELLKILNNICKSYHINDEVKDENIPFVHIEDISILLND